MRTITHTILSFAEMNEEQKAKAIDFMTTREYESGDNAFAEGIDSHHVEVLKAHGFDDIKSEWSGFSSQGDGASFSADSIDVEKFLRKVGQWSQYKALHNAINDGVLTFKIVRSGLRYSHENTVYAAQNESYWPETKNQEHKANELETVLTEFVRKVSREYYRDLESAYNQSVSEEGIKDMIEANEYEFKLNENGEVYALA